MLWLIEPVINHEQRDNLTLSRSSVLNVAIYVKFFICWVKLLNIFPSKSQFAVKIDFSILYSHHVMNVENIGST